VRITVIVHRTGREVRVNNGSAVARVLTVRFGSGLLFRLVIHIPGPLRGCVQTYLDTIRGLSRRDPGSGSCSAVIRERVNALLAYHALPRSWYEHRSFKGLAGISCCAVHITSSMMLVIS
jgi:hypothetical protein